MYYFYVGNRHLFYHEKQQVQYACDWFWNMSSVKMSPFKMAHFLKKVYQYQDIIIIMAYTLFLEKVHSNEINFNKLIEQENFVNPFENT